MAWDDMAYGVKIYIWAFDPRGIVGYGNVGHASMLIRTDGKFGIPAKTTYLSWWPKGGTGGFGNMEHDRPRAYGARGKAATVNDHQPDQARTTDKEREEGSANWKFRIEAGISPNLMHMFVDELIAGTVRTSALAKPTAWNFLTQNCSTTVAHCLRAGGADGYVKWPDYGIWSPDLVFRYARNLTEAIAAKLPGKARQVR